MQVFIDTNLWAHRLDRREPEKSRRISTWLRELANDHDIVVSTQVLVDRVQPLSASFGLTR